MNSKHIAILSITLLSCLSSLTSLAASHEQTEFACAMKRGHRADRGTGIAAKRICTAKSRSYQGLKKAGSVPRDVDLDCQVVGKNTGTETAYLQSTTYDSLPASMSEGMNEKKVLAVYSNGVDTLILYKPKEDSMLIEAEGYHGRMGDGVQVSDLEYSSFDCVLLTLTSDIEEQGAG